MPVTFHNDHYDLLVAQDYLFARKISPEAAELKARLAALHAAPDQDLPVSDDGRALYAFLASRGRVGARHGARFWQRPAGLGARHDVLAVVCKKWDVGKRLAQQLGQAAGIPAYGYLFNEEATPLPDLGGIQTGLEKRRRHAPALLQLLFDETGAQRLVICLDPGDPDRLAQLRTLGAGLRVLNVACRYDTPYLQGHARRMGLVSRTTPPERQAMLERLIREQIEGETARLAELGLPRLAHLRETAPAPVNAQALTEFLAIAPDAALSIARTPTLFAD